METLLDLNVTTLTGTSFIVQVKPGSTAQMLKSAIEQETGQMLVVSFCTRSLDQRKGNPIPFG